MMFHLLGRSSIATLGKSSSVCAALHKSTIIVPSITYISPPSLHCNAVGSRSFASSANKPVTKGYKAYKKKLSDLSKNKFKTQKEFDESINNKLTGFVDDRKDYIENLSSLRKSWKKDYDASIQRKEEERKAERRRVEIEKAVRLRQKRAESAIRQEADRQLKIAANRAFKEKLMREQLIRDVRKSDEQVRYKGLVTDLKDESDSWITKENMHRKIVPALFETPSTTGLVHKYSPIWRYHIESLSLDRFLSPSYQTEADKNNNDPGARLTARLEARAQLKAYEQFVMEDMIDSMIDTGADREKYKEIVKQLTIDSRDEDGESLFQEEIDENQEAMNADSIGNDFSSPFSSGNRAGNDDMDDIDEDEDVEEEDDDIFDTAPPAVATPSDLSSTDDDAMPVFATLSKKEQIAKYQKEKKEKAAAGKRRR